MSVRSFLQSVLPDDGYLIAATLGARKDGKGKVWWNAVVDDLTGLQVKCREWANQSKDVYFALASFADKQVFNPTKKNYKTGELGAYEKRTHNNAKFLRALFMDLDVKPKEPDKHYVSQGDALTALKDFCKIAGLPKPTMVNSGYGIHAYWPLDANVPRDEWLAVAEKLKNAAVVAKLRADHNVTADTARVLRVPGTSNYKKDPPVPVEVLAESGPYDLSMLDAALTQFLHGKSVPQPARKASTPSLAATPHRTSLGNNLGPTNDPLNANAVAFSCAAFRQQLADRGASAREPQWRAALGLARFCAGESQVMLAVSDGHPDFSAADMAAKVANMTAGPTTCATFWKEDNATCEACPHWTKIKSPAQLGREFHESPAPAPVAAPTVTPALKLVFAPPPAPYPYERRLNGDGLMHVVARVVDDDNVTHDTVVCPYDLYPIRILEQEGEEEKEPDECSSWVLERPRHGTTTFKMAQSMLSDTKKLHGFLLSRGLHITTLEAKATQIYMTAYLKTLASTTDRERMHEHLGWHDNYTSFVMPDAIYHRDGTITPHVATRAIEAITKKGLREEGTLDGWVKALEFYLGAHHTEYRVGTCCGFAAPLYHMSMQKGVLIAASGDSGRGKTTMLEAISSIYGHPESMLVGGGEYGATTNAMYTITGTYHSLPVLWDDTTDRESDDMRKFMLHISTGKGKERMIGNKHDGKTVTWETMVISSANTDDLTRIMAKGKDSEAHLMRFISIEFNGVSRDTAAKLRADQFKREIRANYGHAGRIYMAYITQHYDAVYKLFQKEMEKFDVELNIQSQERHRSATLAAIYVGGRIAYKLGLLPFDIKDDRDWLLAKVATIRMAYADASSTPAEMLNELLESKLPNTLILQAKGSSNIDSVAQEPRGALYVRRENDTGLVYITRDAVNRYCDEHKLNMRNLEAKLVLQKVILRKNCHKVLGADTKYAMAQARCWEISRTKLNEVIAAKGA